MAARRKTKPFAEDLDAIRAAATALLALQADAQPMDWTDWELDFLEDMRTRATDEPLSDAQVGKLEQLDRLSTLHSRVDGLSVASLIASCALNVEYLEDENDRAFIRALRTMGVAILRRRRVGRLLRCCRELEVIEPHHGFIEP